MSMCYFALFFILTQVAREKDVMIAGHGAFGVENVAPGMCCHRISTYSRQIRTCCEFSAKRIYLVCRRSPSHKEKQGFITLFST